MIRYLFFALPASLFFWSVAPSIPTGPGGTFTLVVGAGGNANPTGYPLFSIISCLFSFVLPFEDVAYKFNLAAASMGLLSLILIFRIVTFAFQALVQQDKNPLGHLEFFTLAIFLSSGYFVSEALSRVNYLSDRYSTNLAVVILICFFLVKLLRDFYLDRKIRTLDFYFLTCSCTLVLSTHLTMVPFAWLAWLIGLVVCIRAKQIPSTVSSSMAVIIGLVPFLYLPINSSLDPLFNWGEPDTFKKFWYHFTRAEYGKMKQRGDFSQYLTLLLRDWQLFIKQFSVFHFIFCLIGVIYLAMKNWKAAVLLVLSVMTLGPLISYVWPWPPFNEKNLFTDTLSALLVKYFTSYYVLLLGLAGFGLVLTICKLKASYQKASVTNAFCGIIILIGIGLSTQGIKAFNKRDYKAWQDLAKNVEIQVPEGGVIFTFYDTCYSQLAYQQIHHKKLPNRFIIHTNLLFRGWYIETLARLYPDFFAKHREILNEMKTTSRKVEGGDLTLVPKVNQLKTEVLKSIGFTHHKAGVFNCPDPLRDHSSGWTQLGFVVEPKYYLQQLHMESHGLDKIDLSAIKYQSTKEQALGGDPFAKGILVTAARRLRERSQIYKMMDPSYYQAANQLADEILYELD